MIVCLRCRGRLVWNAQVCRWVHFVVADHRAVPGAYVAKWHAD
jgi:hypothetical protein